MVGVDCFDIEEVNTDIVDRYLHADYEGVSREGWSGKPVAVAFRNPQSEGRPSYLYAEDIDTLLEAGEARGYNLPLVRFAKTELADAQRKYRVGRIFNKIGDKVITALGFGVFWATGAVVALALVSVADKAINEISDSANEDHLNAAAPVAGNSGLTYDPKRLTYFQTTKSPRQLLSWTFNEKGGLENACSIAVRQPEDGTLAWWMVPKYNPKCMSGEHLSQLGKLPAPSLRPQ